MLGAVLFPRIALNSCIGVFKNVANIPNGIVTLLTLPDRVGLLLDCWASMQLTKSSLELKALTSVCKIYHLLSVRTYHCYFNFF
jgi:hypothetical protein